MTSPPPTSASVPVARYFSREHTAPLVEEHAAPRGTFLEAFLAIGAWCSLTGWILSLFGALHRVGYAISFAIGFVVLAWWGWTHASRLRSSLHSFRTAWRNRIRKPLPALFLTIFTLAAVGGIAYSPNNYDALTYRLPQVLHWLDAGHWHWIATSNEHLNITGAGYSWLMAPLLALTQSDRALFLPNIIALAMLPGAFFRVACGCGVPRRVAWFWMWIVPSGYCFALQAGSLANDLLPASYLLVATSLAFKARRTGSVVDVWFSILAAALATGIKIVVLPLAIPWLVAIAPSCRLLLKKPAATCLILLIALTASFLPTAILNSRYTGDWSGDPANLTRMQISDPLYGLAANAIQIAVVNLNPPIWPWPGQANSALTHFQAGATGQAIADHFPRFDLRWFELAAEDGAGIGLGIILLASASLAAAVARRRVSPSSAPHWNGWIFCAASVAAALVYGMKMGSEAGPRLFASYYLFLLVPILLLPGQQFLTHRRWWRVLASFCAFSIIPTLILTPTRPLWPAQRALSHLASHHPDSAFLQRSLTVYDTFAQRHDYLAPLKKWIPAEAFTVGFVPTGNDLESSLWWPLGSRRVVEVLTPSRSDSAVQQLSGSVIVCSARGLQEHFQMTVDEFGAAIGGRLIGEETFILKASVGPERWCVIAVE